MFVGHEFLAFALVGWGTRSVGADRDTALRLGGIAALAALLPDLDVAYAAATYAVAVVGGAPLGWDAFWGVANGVHRVVTHPLPIGVVAALVFGAAAATARGTTGTPGHDRDRGRTSSRFAQRAAGTTVAATGVAILLSALWSAVGQAAALVGGVFLLLAGVAGALIGRRTSDSGVTLTAVTGVGFLTHPFGDAFLAVPPPLLSPFGPPLLTERISLAADPTVEILAVLLVELATVWLGVGVALRLGAAELVGFDHRRRLWDLIDVRSATGLSYGAAVFVLPRPTVVDAHLLGFTVVPLALAVGLWAGCSHAPRSPSSRANHRAGIAIGILTGLTALTLSAAAYLLTYLVTL